MSFEQLSQRLYQARLPKPSSGNQRAYADLIEEKACEQAKVHYGLKYAPSGSVRSPEDFSINLEIKHLIDVKTRRLDTEFNMPNLISVDRLDRILSDPATDLWYWLMDYEVLADGTCLIRHSQMRSVWSLPWDALAIQNLGKGQLQIKYWAKLDQHLDDRDDWLAELRHRRKAFYLKQAAKFQKMADAIRS